MKMPVDFATYSAPASPYLMLAGSHSWKMVIAFPWMTNFLFLALMVMVEFAVGRVILGQVDHGVEVNEWITDHNNIYFARAEGVPDSQAPRQGPVLTL